ncbi:hypothetical protein COHA_009229 [Chlorella ohadii]|uniref:Uncharacterized protein n=1 Tax=Chlorella ohadii TaxID=2649997 RepID=A0AAD5DF43_9CHLO|nr:hypothetical protein COHA_009229 [Chlorella ohadii]
MARFALTLALAACLAACASAALPQSFNTTGAPPVLTGGFYILNSSDSTTLAVGWMQGNNVRIVSGSGTDQFSVTEGTYQSWQCSSDLPGAYNALISLTTTAADGTKTTKTVCELGLWSGFGYVDFAQSESECPTMPELAMNALTPSTVEFPCAAPAIDTLPPGDLAASPELPPADMVGGAPSPAPAM